MLQTGSITEYLYGADTHHLAKEQHQQYISDISLLPSQLVIDSPYSVFLQELAAISEKEKRVIRIGELPVLRQQLMDRMKITGFDSVVTHAKGVILAVAVTLSQFHAAWLETASTMDSAGSDTTSRVYGLPHMARIWLILHNMRQQHILDSFCASRMTDESLPLDILTLESIFPPDEKLHSLRFYEQQFHLVQGFTFREDPWHQGSGPIGGPYLELLEASSGNPSRKTLSRVSFAGTTSLTGDPPGKETALEQPASTKKAVASTSSDSGGSRAEATTWTQPASTKKAFASISSDTDDPTVEGISYD